MSTPKILPCPFCGGRAELQHEPMWSGHIGYHGRYSVRVRCADKKCGAMLPFRYDSVGRSIEEADRLAIADWNRRPEDV